MPRPAREISLENRPGPGWARRSEAIAQGARARPASNAAPSLAADSIPKARIQETAIAETTLAETTTGEAIGRNLGSKTQEDDRATSAPIPGNRIRAAPRLPTKTPTSLRQRAATPGGFSSSLSFFPRFVFPRFVLPHLVPIFLPTNGHYPSRFSSGATRAFTC